MRDAGIGVSSLIRCAHKWLLPGLAVSPAAKHRSAFRFPPRSVQTLCYLAQKSLRYFGVFIVPSSNLFSKQMMSHARSAWWLETESYARIVPPPPRFTRQPQKEKMFLAFRIWRDRIFSENGKDIFLFGVLPSKYSGRWRNNADEVLAKLFFGERICQNFGSFVFEFGCRKWKRRGLGRNFPFAPLISFGEIRAGFWVQLF